MVAMTKKILDYFDLNKRTLSASEVVELFSIEVVEMEEKSPSSTVKNNNTIKKEISCTGQLIMYFGLILGVYLSKILNTKTLSIDTIPDWLTLIAAAFFALILIPQVYEKLQVDPNSPFIVRFGLFVQNGFFWQVIFDSIHK